MFILAMKQIQKSVNSYFGYVQKKSRKDEELGALIISLDFELNWGVHDVFTIENYGENILGARLAIPKILQLFQKYDIHATWAIVGMLYCKDKQELLSFLESIEIPYENETLSAKYNLSNVGANEQEDLYHYGDSLINMIKKIPNQEIGTHTFSHYYCLEKGQRIEHFEKDLQAMVELNEGVTSLVFPRNQVNLDYLQLCDEYGITAYRGNENSWIYGPYIKEMNTTIKRMLRLADHYINITGHNSYKLEKVSTHPIINVPSSRFLRPYSSKLRILERLRLQRIKHSLTEAAKNNEYYHLWWHPHNFGKNTEKNLQFLEEILQHVEYLKGKYKFQSMHMRDVVGLINLNKTN
ncbi:polysaccharide deacetylase family protein [Viridibacillus sp. FSL R5-0477]|uniref:Polysaccharide deacetylase n=2 Tax=Viridibacillus TaxID=496496 RepID=W4EYY6_9BACL|nr:MULTISPECIES: polysaccharide deacetylase family protein [Viridibacillus]ETT85282.1 polysaccharide deacetylase [Viridibacillus arenosi FSL R5-213]